MPTIFFKLGFGFYFVSYDCREPLHVHVGDDAGKVCKFWLENDISSLADNAGFKKRELVEVY